MRKAVFTVEVLDMDGEASFLELRNALLDAFYADMDKRQFFGAKDIRMHIDDASMVNDTEINGVKYRDYTEEVLDKQQIKWVPKTTRYLRNGDIIPS